MVHWRGPQRARASSRDPEGNRSEAEGGSLGLVLRPPGCAASG